MARCVSFALRLSNAYLSEPVLTIVFNILVTAMIAVRLLSVHKKMSTVLGTEMTKRYTGLLAILVESALPFTVLGICYLAVYIKDLPEALAFADIWGCFVVRKRLVGAQSMLTVSNFSEPLTPGHYSPRRHGWGLDEGRL